MKYVEAQYAAKVLLQKAGLALDSALIAKFAAAIPEVVDDQIERIASEADRLHYGDKWPEEGLYEVIRKRNGKV